MGGTSSQGASPPLRLDVAYDQAAADAVDAALLLWERTDQVVEVIDWTLAHDPKAGMALTESGNVRSFTYEGAVSAKMPTAVVLYSIERDLIGEPVRIAINDIDFRQPKAFQHGTA